MLVRNFTFDFHHKNMSEFEATHEDGAWIPQFDWTVDWPGDLPSCYGLFDGDDDEHLHVDVGSWWATEEYCTQFCTNNYGNDISWGSCENSWDVDDAT
jgi:hypothetical protein